MPFHWYGVCGLGTKFDTDGRHLDVAAADFLADGRDVLGHVHDAVQVDRTLAGQAAQEIQLDALPAVLERLPAAFVQVVVLDLLADLLAHVVAGHFGRQRQAALGARPASATAATAADG